jgi:uncharacterized protein (DUF1684 family)
MRAMRGARAGCVLRGMRARGASTGRYPRTSSGGGRAERPVSGGDAKFRQDRENTLKSDAGWLTIGGLWFLTQPKTAFGSDPLSDIVFPASAPPQAGTFELQNGKVTVRAASGVTFLLDGKPFTSGELKPDVPGPADRLSLGEHLQFWVHVSGDRLSIRLRDQNNSLRKEFVGLSWFPVNAGYRVEARYTPYDKAKTVDVPTILGDIDKATIPGIVSFMLNGQEYKLEPYAEAGRPAVLVCVPRSHEPEGDVSGGPIPVRTGARGRQDDARLQQDREPALCLQPVLDVPAAQRAESAAHAHRSGGEALRILRVERRRSKVVRRKSGRKAQAGADC